MEYAECTACNRTLAGSEPIRLHGNPEGCNDAGLSAYEDASGVVWSYADDGAWKEAKAAYEHPLRPLLKWLAKRTQGHRNAGINWAAYKASEYVANGIISEEEAFNNIFAVSLLLDDDEPGWEREIAATIRSGLRAGLEQQGARKE